MSGSTYQPREVLSAAGHEWLLPCEFRGVADRLSVAGLARSVSGDR